MVPAAAKIWNLKNKKCIVSKFSNYLYSYTYSCRNQSTYTYFIGSSLFALTWIHSIHFTNPSYQPNSNKAFSSWKPRFFVTMFLDTSRILWGIFFQKIPFICFSINFSFHNVRWNFAYHNLVWMHRCIQILPTVAC